MPRTDEAKWKRIVSSVKAGTSGGKAGQWSARKAQLATKRYKASGGGYSGAKTDEQKFLTKWTKEKWGTKSGKIALRVQVRQASGTYLRKLGRH